MELSISILFDWHNKYWLILNISPKFDSSYFGSVSCFNSHSLGICTSSILWANKISRRKSLIGVSYRL